MPPSVWGVRFTPRLPAPHPFLRHPPAPAVARRVPTGTPLTDPPLIEMISSDPVLKDTKLIAEAWDCDGLNQVGGHSRLAWACRAGLGRAAGGEPS